MDLDDPKVVITKKEPAVFDLAVCLGRLAGLTTEEVLPDLISIIAKRMPRDPKTISAATLLS